jgi:hypothetical protein
MKLRNFVSGSSIVLVGWLVVTFLHEVPAQSYPKLRKYPATAKSASKRPPGEVAARLPESVEFPVSVSR